eukprot:CAMPEP_0119103464 /NCGR_PEP_ID=MMETSP1180-20130426/1901_1 /TAXON_ID=3052 ORGANISM="Chlamydomonas cf sp, Strain CCMP681" /NCGR_SAMPLE_ID=MMETSP1180 /ASSEMBLY_ACC=CAM_ASM_000741 /LENGTH=151 /DNA_ID=CAMNT_0007087973 /DNA_START=12 /DNA_END=468 /DNA_ORIENTATION=-
MAPALVQAVKARKLMEQVLARKGAVDAVLVVEDYAECNAAVQTAGLCDKLLSADFDGLCTDINKPLLWRAEAVAVINAKGPVTATRKLLKQGELEDWSTVVCKRLHGLIASLNAILEIMTLQVCPDFMALMPGFVILVTRASLELTVRSVV